MRRLSDDAFAPTNRRVLAKVGWRRRRSVDVLLCKVECISVARETVRRLLGYGTVVIIGTGGTREPFSGIAHPLDFRNRVQAQINRAAEGMHR